MLCLKGAIHWCSRQHWKLCCSEELKKKIKEISKKTSKSCLMWEMYIDTLHIHYSLRKRRKKVREEGMKRRKGRKKYGRKGERKWERKKEGKKKGRREWKGEGYRKSYGDRWKGITTNCINCILCRARTRPESVQSPGVMSSALALPAGRMLPSCCSQDRNVKHRTEKVFYMLLNTGTTDAVTAWVCRQTTHPAE